MIVFVRGVRIRAPGLRLKALGNTTMQSKTPEPSSGMFEREDLSMHQLFNQHYELLQLRWGASSAPVSGFESANDIRASSNSAWLGGSWESCASRGG